VLHVPPGVPHGFKDIVGFRAFLIRFDTSRRRTGSRSTAPSAHRCDVDVGASPGAISEDAALRRPVLALQWELVGHH
jgi:hypothetical protein